ncbi:MAG: hypothetical protein KDH15_20325 [Rhodocyclaceae bacterium]|nr:hypothetical protein [Rhodocyclaceae bacterium]
MTDRRSFINTCAAGTAALLAPAGVLAADLAGRPARPATGNRVSEQTFRELVNEGFRCIGAANGAVRLELTEVWPGPKAPGIEQFGLVLGGSHGGSAAAPLPAGLYRLHHWRTGTVEVYLTPSDSHPDAYVTHFGVFA